MQVGGSNINLSNPAAVNFNGVAPGSYNLSYIVEANTIVHRILHFCYCCDSKDQSQSGPGRLCAWWNLGNKVNDQCSRYHHNIGNCSETYPGYVPCIQYTARSGVTINASSANNVCQASLVLTAPNCACPFIPAPTGNTSYTACESTVASIVMTVAVPAGMQAGGLVPVGALRW